MRLSTAVKRSLLNQGIPALRAIRDGSMIRITVPRGTERLPDEVRRQDAYSITGQPVKKEWVWVKAPDNAAAADPCDAVRCCECHIGGCRE